MLNTPNADWLQILRLDSDTEHLSMALDAMREAKCIVSRIENPNAKVALREEAQMLIDHILRELDNKRRKTN